MSSEHEPIPEITGQPFGAGHPLYHEGGGLINSAQNVIGWTIVQIVRAEGWRRRPHDTSRHDAWMARIEEKDIQLRLDDTERISILKLGIAERNNPSLKPVLYQAQEAFHSRQALALGSMAMKLEADKPFAHTIRGWVAEKRQSRQVQKAAKAAAKLIEITL